MYSSVPMTLPTSVTIVVMGASSATMRARPKIQHLRRAVGLDEDVRRFQVAVNHAALMGVVNRVADPGKQRQASVQTQRRPAPIAHVATDITRQRQTLDKLHDEEMLALGRAAGVVDSGYVGGVAAGPAC